MICSQKEECNPTGTENYFISKQYIVYILFILKQYQTNNMIRNRVSCQSQYEIKVSVAG